MFYKITFALLIIILLLTFLLIGSEDKVTPPQKNVIPEDTVEISINHDQILKSKELDQYFKRRHEKIGFNGSVLFAEKGVVLYQNVFGYADVRKKKKIDSYTKFQIASVSKPFTTYAIMLLKQKGELSYEDSVQHFFPEFPYKGITIRLLMIHKSGLPEYFYFADKLWEDRKVPISNIDVIDLMIEHQPQRYYGPDRKYNYINTNYCLLAAIVEKVSGETFEDFMNEEIYTLLLTAVASRKRVYLRLCLNDMDFGLKKGCSGSHFFHLINHI